MVNTGKPSSGCARCRKRRIKCDEGYPDCERCTRLGIVCPGYNRDFRFKPFFPIPCTTPVKPRDWSRVSSSTSGSISTASGSSDRSPTDADDSVHNPRPSRSPELVLTRNLDLALEPRSIELFMSSFVYSLDSTGSDTYFLDFLPEMYLAADPNSSLVSTVAAVARLNFMSRYRAGLLSSWVTTSYAKALADTNQALSTPATAYTDTTVAAVWLLSLFELLLGKSEAHRQPRNVPWSRHVDGAVALLVARGTEQLKSPRGLQLFRLVHTTAMISLMLDYKAPPTQLWSMITEYLEASPQTDQHELWVSKNLHALAEKRASASAHSSCPLHDQEDHTSFHRAASADSTWQPRKMTRAVHDCPHGPPEYSRYFFHSGFVMSNWLTYWASRLLHLQISLDDDDDGTDLDDAQESKFPTTNPATADPSNSRQTHRHLLLTQLESTSSDILGTVSFALGDVDVSGHRRRLSSLAATATEEAIHAGSGVGAVHVLWPLGVVLQSRYTRPAQKRLAREALRRVGGVFGVTRALDYV